VEICAWQRVEKTSKTSAATGQSIFINGCMAYGIPAGVVRAARVVWPDAQLHFLRGGARAVVVWLYFHGFRTA
jgi:hypothetical protein